MTKTFNYYLSKNFIDYSFIYEMLQISFLSAGSNNIMVVACPTRYNDIIFCSRPGLAVEGLHLGASPGNGVAASFVTRKRVATDYQLMLAFPIL